MPTAACPGQLCPRYPAWGGPLPSAPPLLSEPPRIASSRCLQTDFPSLSLFAKVFPLLAAMTYPWLLKPCGSPETQALSHPGLAYHQHNTEKPSMGTAGVSGSEDVTF